MRRWPSTAAHRNLGTTLQAQGKLGEAEIREVVRLKPGDVKARINFGIALRDHGQLDEAIAAIRRASEQLPGSAYLLTTLADLLANHTDPTHRDPSAAVELSLKAVEQNPSERACRMTLGQAQLRAGQLDASMDTLEKSMQMSKGGGPDDWYFVAMIHARRGQPEEASRWLGRANGWVDKDDRSNARFEQYRAEAEALIMPSGSGARPEGR